MKRIWLHLLMLVLLGAASPLARGDDNDTASEAHAPAAVDETHPVYSNDARWVSSFLVAVGGLFLAALIVGPIVRAEAPEVVPAAMSHEEDPAADRVGHVADPSESTQP